MTDFIRQQLRASRERLRSCHLGDMRQLQRETVCTLLTAADIKADISRQLLDDEALADLINLAERRGFHDQRRALYTEEHLNFTEGRAALHTVLRAAPEDKHFSSRQLSEVQQTLAKLSHFTEMLLRGDLSGATGKPIRDLVHIGIGGSYLGSKMTCQALAPYALHRVRNHYVANMDGAALAAVLAKISPDQTLFTLASKSFTTREVLVNMRSAQSWLLERGIPESGLMQHFIALTAHPERAAESGITEDRCFLLWDWVVGRFSIWSAIGLPLAVQLGMQGFQEFLGGARQIDTHFRVAEPASNLPLLLALTDIWNTNALNLNSYAVLPYSQFLELLPAWLQQLQMESNGKRRCRSGDIASYRTSPVLWGGAGTNGEHSYHQFLHQSTERTFVDFILPQNNNHSLPDHQDWLVSACLAQAETLAEGDNLGAIQGRGEDMPAHRELPGNRPGNMIMLPDLTPRVLGQLLALFEHRVFCQGMLWDINPFDQFGVERGKVMATRLHDAITQQRCVGNEVTDRYLALYQEIQSASNR